MPMPMVIKIAARDVAAELQGQGIDPDEFATLTIEPEALPGRRASRARVVAAGLSDDDIDQLIKQAQNEVEILLPQANVASAPTSSSAPRKDAVSAERRCLIQLEDYRKLALELETGSPKSDRFLMLCLTSACQGGIVTGQKCQRPTNV